MRFGTSLTFTSKGQSKRTALYFLPYFVSMEMSCRPHNLSCRLKRSEMETSMSDIFCFLDVSTSVDMTDYGMTRENS